MVGMSLELPVRGRGASVIMILMLMQQGGVALVRAGVGAAEARRSVMSVMKLMTSAMQIDQRLSEGLVRGASGKSGLIDTRTTS